MLVWLRFQFFKSAWYIPATITNKITVTLTQVNTLVTVADSFAPIIRTAVFFLNHKLFNKL